MEMLASSHTKAVSELATALGLPKTTTEFSLSVKSGGMVILESKQLVKVDGVMNLVDRIQKFELSEKNGPEQS